MPLRSQCRRRAFLLNGFGTSCEFDGAPSWRSFVSSSADFSAVAHKLRDVCPRSFLNCSIEEVLPARYPWADFPLQRSCSRLGTGCFDYFLLRLSICLPRPYGAFRSDEILSLVRVKNASSRVALKSRASSGERSDHGSSSPGRGPLCPTLTRISFALWQQFCLGRAPRPVVPMPSALLPK